MNRFVLADQQTAVFCLNQEAKEYKGLRRVMGYVCNDIMEITGRMPEILPMKGDKLLQEGTYAERNIVVAGTIGENAYIDQKIKENKINVREIEGKRECYRMLVIKDQDMVGNHEILVIAGSDKLGTIYGLLHVSELMGITPWGYWADVKPKKKDKVEIPYELLNCVSKEPSIKLRGFFLNDEWPSLGNFVSQAFGDFNEKFYEKVFELLLRLKGNYLWPAMWSAVFSEDGESDHLANARLAEELGIIMGTSHHEPLMRAGEEFDHYKSDSNDKGYGADWNFYTNPRGLKEFWNDSVVRNKEFRNLITIGMRGERDSKILDESCGLKENIQLLKDVILAQKEILKNNGMEHEPKMLALYKEVEDYYYGDDTCEGLKDWEELDDVMLLLSDDNFGNARTLPTIKNWNRKGGWGLYYHVDYHGGPISYEWINSTPIAKMWEQMCEAYEYGIRDLWILNVGDLRPQELPLTYFMSLAYDFDTYGSKAVNTSRQFLSTWVKSIFGEWVNDKIVKDIETLVDGYTRMNGDRRPEATYEDTFSILNENEAGRELQRALDLEQLEAETAKKIPSAIQDAYYGLVGFPVCATANLRKMMILTSYQKYFAKEKCVLANELHQRVQDCILRDQELVRKYNEDMAGGKWKGMMSSKHVAFVNWNDEGSAYPTTTPVEASMLNNAQMFVEGQVGACDFVGASLPIFTNTEKEIYHILITNDKMDTLTVKSEPYVACVWTQLTKEAAVAEVTIDWQQLQKSEESILEINVNGLQYQVKVQAMMIQLPAQQERNLFIESKGYISMGAADYVEISERKEYMDDERLMPLAYNTAHKFLQPIIQEDSGYCYPEWKELKAYGRAESSMKVLPSIYSCSNPEEAPAITYRFYIEHEGDYTMNVHYAPSNNLEKFKGLRTAYSLDDGKYEIVDLLPEGYMAGESADASWSKAVLDNVREQKMHYHLSKGIHTIRIALVDAGVVIQKIEFYQKPSNTYYGYRTSCHL